MQGNVFYFGWEVQLMTWLQSLMGPIGVTLAKAMTMLGENVVLVVIVALFYFCLNKEQGKLILASVGAGMVWNPLLKNVALRRRPYFDNEAIKCLQPVDAAGDIYDIHLQGYSFPSGHSQHCLTIFGMAARALRRRWVTMLAVIVPLLVGLSRVMLGVHYPTDVLVGWIIGLVCITVVPFLWQRLGQRMVYLILVISGFPGLFYCVTADFYAGYGLLIGAILGFLLEERFVRFQATRSPVQGCLRLVCAGALYAILNTVLKLPFDHAWLNSGSFSSLLVRLARYAAVGFVLFGVYPLSFKWMEKLTAKKEGVSL